MQKIKKNPKMPHLFRIDLRGRSGIATENLVAGNSIYGEIIINECDTEYRMWDPRRSKLAALINKGYTPEIGEDSIILYLGAASGTTVSHLSDIVTSGIIFAVEFSQRPMTKLIRVCEPRRNLIPIFSDAHHPEEYSPMVPEVDIIYQDIAQRDQIEIALLNAKFYLKMGGTLILMLKTRSIDSTAKPTDLAKQEIEKLKGNFSVIKTIDLRPFHKDHQAIIAKYDKIGS
ncbi:MAG: fibrillarin-like rRNA/tRNA 2'-O-methyltransferase [Halobacteriota archaeon]|nr:fibrillarin-like rRNA/tRNA 2'-O-methyltransferase [Halobacteriota archaeon]